MCNTRPPDFLVWPVSECRWREARSIKFKIMFQKHLKHYARAIHIKHLHLIHRITLIYEGRLQSSWTHLITPSRNFLEVRWRPVFRSVSLGKRCTSYNAPPTSRKRAADRLPQALGRYWSRRFWPRSSLFMVGKAQKSHGRDLDCTADVLMGSTDLGELIHFHFSIAQRWHSTGVAPLS
jgi:hypothetical protein